MHFNHFLLFEFYIKKELHHNCNHFWYQSLTCLSFFYERSYSVALLSFTQSLTCSLTHSVTRITIYFCLKNRELHIIDNLLLDVILNVVSLHLSNNCILFYRRFSPYFYFLSVFYNFYLRSTLLFVNQFVPMDGLSLFSLLILQD